MHDLFHDLAERVSKGDCLSIEDDHVKEIPPTIRLMVKIYHLSAATEKCKKLPVLWLQLGTSAQTLLKSLGYLKHLRYLHIHMLNSLELPQSWVKLYHLQLLCSPSGSSLPRSLGNLINLRHFEGNERALTALPDIGRLTSLVVDVYFDVKKEKGYDIVQLQNLNELRGLLNISNLQNVEGKDKAAEANLKDKQHLPQLILKWENDDGRDCRRDLDMEVLEGLQPHPNLAHLSIYGYQSPMYPSWLLQQGCLQNLMSLMLYECTALEVLQATSHLFPRCLKLEIYYPYNLKKLHLLPQSLHLLPQTLNSLQLIECPGILSLPDLPESLTIISISECPVLEERCRSPDGEDPYS